MIAAFTHSLSTGFSPSAAVKIPAAANTQRACAPGMCGILAVSGCRDMDVDTLKLKTLTLQRLVRHRGPDGSGIHVIDNHDGTTSAIAHERLAIMVSELGLGAAAAAPAASCCY